MNCICRTFNFVAYLALLTAGPAFTQTLSDEATPEGIAAASVAHVYVQTHKGVAVYDATAAGKLTLVKGSSFADTGQMEGVNGKYLISVGTYYIHTYTIEPDGGVGKQASEINTQDYEGSECGTIGELGPGEAVLDHTGHYFYLELYGAPGEGGVYAMCAAWQSYRVQSNGALTFLGSIEYAGSAGHDATESTTPTFSSNDNFAYGIFGEYEGFSTTALSTFTRTAAGDLDVNENFTEKDPATDPNLPNGPWYYFPELVQADPANHLAVLLVNQSFQGNGFYGPQQLASYTINATGGISSTNTWEDMPTPEVSTIGSMDMAPSGKLLAVAGAPGLQIFHFSGAAPITKYSALLLPTIDIDQLAWDNDNHLYALSYSSGELYVYTVTPTEIREASGSPYRVENAYGISGLIVVPKL